MSKNRSSAWAEPRLATTGVWSQRLVSAFVLAHVLGCATERPPPLPTVRLNPNTAAGLAPDLRTLQNALPCAKVGTMEDRTQQRKKITTLAFSTCIDETASMTSGELHFLQQISDGCRTETTRIIVDRDSLKETGTITTTAMLGSQLDTFRGFRERSRHRDPSIPAVHMADLRAHRVTVTSFCDGADSLTEGPASAFTIPFSPSEVGTDPSWSKTAKALEALAPAAAAGGGARSSPAIGTRPALAPVQTKTGSP